MTVQTVFAVPVLISVLLFVVVCGRLVETRLRVDSAAQDAARAASLARSSQDAQTVARGAVAGDLGGGGPNCGTYTVTTDTTDFRPGGSVRVSVRCAATMSGLSGLGLPGVVGVNSHAASPIDQYRGIT
ncbi:TadE/TadG family type IV pilus assembly protein [Catenulispora acidiphila]|uniref:TadE/TadG family type IV pilus assembly protein n=1 Tax=Catenulispora acidiphila TaxID=304895 RepID=UPI000676A5A9|nr:TadE/TadG family type IV pilus assembly protein [Catenulispora acidiphila]